MVVPASRQARDRDRVAPMAWSRVDTPPSPAAVAARLVRGSVSFHPGEVSTASVTCQERRSPAAACAGVGVTCGGPGRCRVRIACGTVGHDALHARDVERSG